jgi:cytochrome P450
MQTILIVLATVLPRFKFRLANAESVFPEARVTLRPAGGLPVFVTPRQ